MLVKCLVFDLRRTRPELEVGGPDPRKVKDYEKTDGEQVVGKEVIGRDCRQRLQLCSIEFKCEQAALA